MKKKGAPKNGKYSIVVYYSPEDECYIGKALESPDCMAHGYTPEEA